MEPNDWRGLIKGMMKFFHEEMKEPEHQAADESQGQTARAHGELNEQEKSETERTPKEREEMPKGVFLEPGDHKYPVKVKRDGDWKYSRDLLLAAAREARMHGHEDIAARADKLREQKFPDKAADEQLAFDKGTLLTARKSDRFAFDRASVRSIDADGRLHVALTPISKANVCPYFGYEIPGWQELGLDEDKIYQLYRDPEELAKGAATSNGIQLLWQHVPVSIDDHRPDDIVGSVGTDAVFKAPYLMNSLTIWTDYAIKAIESGEKRELSSSYRYTPDPTPGEADGVKYDMIMRDIHFNHVAMVEQGRVGKDCYVMDSDPFVDIKTETTKLLDESKEEKIEMSKANMTRGAFWMQGALAAYLAPKLANDANIDLTKIVSGVTSKNYKQHKPAIALGIQSVAKDKLAQDANLDDLMCLLDKLDVPAEEAADMEPNAGAPMMKAEAKDDMDMMDDPSMDDGLEELKAMLKAKLSDEDYMKACAMLDAGKKASDEPPEFEGKPEVGKGPANTKKADDAMEDDTAKKAEDEDDKDDEKKDEKKDMMDKKAMDAAITAASEAAVARAVKRTNDIWEAKNRVKPWVGELALTFDSAEAVYRKALEIRGYHKAKTIHTDALIDVLETLPRADAKPAEKEKLAMDSAQVNAFYSRFPNASRIGLN